MTKSCLITSKILFLYLDAFSAAGGIQNYTRVFLKALEETAEENHFAFQAFSLYDDQADSKYLQKLHFQGYRGAKTSFLRASLIQGFKADLLILSHIHLAPIALFLKTFKPNLRVFLMVHGFEVWHRPSFWKRYLLRNMSGLIANSFFTKEKLQVLYEVDSRRIYVLYPALDPNFRIPRQTAKPSHWLEQYKIDSTARILLTICRMSSFEQLKGYDRVIQALPRIREKVAKLHYLLVGKADEKELERIQKLIAERHLENHVTLTGFVPEEKLAEHYQLADVFVMPSTGEGFGIAFLEAAACGKPVLGGNQDGSVEALQQGKFGVLVNPDNTDAIADALIEILTTSKGTAQVGREEIHKIFGYPKFKENVKNLLEVVS